MLIGVLVGSCTVRGAEEISPALSYTPESPDEAASEATPPPSPSPVPTPSPTPDPSPTEKAQLIKDKNLFPSEGIENLQWKQLEYEVQYEYKDEETLVPFVIIQGKITISEADLLWDADEVELSEGKEDVGSFSLKIYPKGTATVIPLYLINSDGVIQREKMVLNILGWENLQLKRNITPRVTKRWSLSPSLGTSLLFYRQTNFSPLNETALTAKVGYSYQLLPPSWDVGITAYMTVAVLNSNQPGITVHFLGINGRLGYFIPAIQTHPLVNDQYSCELKNPHRSPLGLPLKVGADIL